MAKMQVKSFESLEHARAHYIKEIDRVAEESRANVITAAPGQAMSYEAKYQEASRWPNNPPFPWLEGEAQALSMTVEAVKDSVLLARQQWEGLGVTIEAARLKAKKDVNQASSAASMKQATEELETKLL